MASSIISYLQKIRDGVVFNESFENDNFITAEGWTILQGVPGNSSQQFIDGIKSWDNAAGSQSLPVAKKVISDTAVDSDWYFSCFFYDDATNTTDQGPFVKLKLVDGKYLQMGVRNGTSTTLYVTGTNTFAADTFQVATGGTAGRVSGWRFFTIIYLSATTNYRYFIDDVEVAVFTAAASSPVSEIYLQANTVGGTGSSFGYFDALTYNRKETLDIYASFSGRVKLNDNANANQDSQGFTSTVPASFQVWNEAGSVGTLYPFQVYLEVGDTSHNLSYRSNLLQVNPGDIYQFTQIDFERKVTTYENTPRVLQSVNTSTSGVRETLDFAQKYRLTFTVNGLEGVAWNRTVQNFFQNAVAGNTFALMIDSSTDAAFGVISASVGGGTSATVTIMPNFSTNPTDAFTVGNYYTILKQGNTLTAVMKLASKTSNTLTFDSLLPFGVDALDYVYPVFLYPFLEISGSELTGFRLSDVGIPRYNWTQNCEEFNNG